MRNLVAFALSSLLSSAASADLLRCNIETILWAGAPPEDNSPLSDENLMSEPIIVSTTTGETDHFWLGNTSYTNRFLLDQGSEMSPFKVIAFSGPTDGSQVSFRNSNFTSVRIGSPSKQIVVVMEELTVLGICE